MNVGDPLNETTLMGPMVRADDASRVNDWIQSAVQSGARTLI